MRAGVVVMVVVGLAAACRGVPNGYGLVWSDEFAGDSLDAGKWEHRAPGPRRGGYNVPSAVSVSGGVLSISTSYNAALGRYETGMIGTQPTFQQTYGYYEARIGLQTQAGHWSAFWLQSPTISTVSTPPNPAVNGTEIDIMEYRAAHPTGVQHAMHWNGYGSGHQTTTAWRAPAGFANQQWHTFGLLWTESAYTFYIDGTATWTTSTAVSQRSQYLVLSLEVPVAGTSEATWVGGNIADATLPDSLLVDYVRVYAVPEPSALLLAGVGMGLLLRRRRKIHHEDAKARRVS